MDYFLKPPAATVMGVWEDDESNLLGGHPRDAINVAAGWADPLSPWRRLVADASLSTLHGTELYDHLCKPQGQQEHCSADEKACR